MNEIEHALSRHRALQGVNSARIASLAARCTALTLGPEGVLFRQGDASDHLYFVDSGELRISCRAQSGVEVVVGRVSAGGMVGELGVLDGRRRGATVSAVEAAVLIQMPGPVMGELVAGADAAAFALLRFLRRSMVSRIREVDERVDATFESRMEAHP